MMANSRIVSLTLFLILLHCAVENDAQLLEQKRQLADLLPAWLFRNLAIAAPRQKNSALQPSKEPIEVLNWPSSDVQFGQITGVAVNPNGDPVIFHRGSVRWEGNSFDNARRYKLQNQGAIQEDLIVTLDNNDGKVLDRWGRGLFFMPHGLEIDSDGNTWVTDVALHQVFKFANGSTVPSLTLGEAFVPGKDDSHFCQPTDVAVASSGVFFVADGYCNRRIMKFAADGTLLDIYKGSFTVPHSLALLEQSDTLCVADRENSRVVCLSAGLNENGEFGNSIISSNRKNTGPIYAIAGKEDNIYAVSASSFPRRKASGYMFNLDQLDAKPVKWGPSKGFGTLHDVAISRDGESMFTVEINPNRITKFALE